MRVSAALSDFTNNSADFLFPYFVENGYENFRQIFLQKIDFWISFIPKYQNNGGSDTLFQTINTPVKISLLFLTNL